MYTLNKKLFKPLLEIFWSILGNFDPFTFKFLIFTKNKKLFGKKMVKNLKALETTGVITFLVKILV